MSTPRTLDLHPSVVPTRIEVDGTSVAMLDAQPSDGLANGRVLLVPGFTGSKEDFGELLPLLSASGWHAATYDQRGQYESPRGTLHPGLEAWGADVLQVAAAHFGTAERIHLVGHSFGGLVARAAAVAAPERWASLTLLCSGPGAITARRDALQRLADIVESDGLEAALAAKADHDEAQRRQTDGAPTPEVEEFVHRRFVTNDPHALAGMARILADTPDATEALAASGVPTAVVRGARDDAWPHDEQDDMAARLGTQVEVVPESAHSPNVENPDGCRDALVRHFMASDRL